MSTPAASYAASIIIPPTAQSDPSQTVLAGPGVRCCACLLDMAAMLSPALPLAVAAALLSVAEVVYIVVPVAWVAVWIWMQLWQGFTGMTFGKSVLGLRLIRAADGQAPGFFPCVGRSLLFTVTAGLVALPAVTSATPRDGHHDRICGLSLLDVTIGANPLGPRQQTALRKTIDRSLKKVSSPVPLSAGHR